MPLWQKECVRRTLLDGEHGRPEAKTEVVTQMNGREMTMIETITCNDLPNGFSETYETAGVWNGIDHHFAVLEHRTQWRTVNESCCSGLMMKFMMLVAPGMFGGKRKPSEQLQGLGRNLRKISHLRLRQKSRSSGREPLVLRWPPFTAPIIVPCSCWDGGTGPKTCRRSYWWRYQPRHCRALSAAGRSRRASRGPGSVL